MGMLVVFALLSSAVAAGATLATAWGCAAGAGADTAGAGAVSAWASGCGAKVLLAAVLSLSWLGLGCRLAMGALACAEK